MGKDTVLKGIIIRIFTLTFAEGRRCVNIRRATDNLYIIYNHLQLVDRHLAYRRFVSEDGA